MKKIISIVLAMAMLACGINASAAVDTLYQALTAQYMSGITETEYSLTLNRPLTFLKQFDQQLMGQIKPVDIKQLTESAFGMSEKATAEYSVSDTYDKIRFAAESELNLPLEVNDNLRADIWAQVGMWMELDVSDVNKPVYNMIFKLPFSDNYLVMDYGDMLSSGVDIDQLTAALDYVSSEEYMTELNDYVLDLIKTNCTVKELKAGREYVITADDAGVKAIVGGVMKKVFEIAGENMGDAAKEIYNDEFYAEMDALGAKLNNIPVLGSEGVKVRVVVNGKKLVSVDTDINVCVNIYDIMEAFGSDVVQYNRDEWYVDFSLTTKTAYQKLGEDVEIEFPEIDSTNSASLSDPYGYSSYYNDISVYTSYPVEPDASGSFLIPLRDAAASVGLDTDEYAVADGKVDIIPAAEDATVAKAAMEIGSNKMLVNGNEKTLSRRVETDRDGVVLIPADAVGFMTNSDISFANVRISGAAANEISYTPAEESTLADLGSLIDYDGYYPEGEADSEDYVYISSVMSFYSDGVPYVVNNMVYVPVEGIMNQFDVESVTADGSVITVTAPGENPREFSELVFTAGSKTVRIDGKDCTMNNPVVSRDGVVYMPVEFFELINCEPGSIQYYFEGDYRLVVYRNLYASSYDDSGFDYESMMEYRALNVMIYEPVLKTDAGYYLPLRPLMGEFKVRDENIRVDGDSVTVTSENPATGFAKLTINGTKITVDGTEYTIDSGIRDINGTTYVPQQLVTDVLGGEITNVSVKYGENAYTQYTVKVKNPLYVEQQAE